MKSQVGAVGVMQLMPAPGRQLQVGDITRLEPNIHAGTKYLHQLRTKYFDDPQVIRLDRPCFSFAAYNAGPGNVKQMRALALAPGLDPDRWFGNVERVTLQHVGLEPVRYVSNIPTYYLAYRL